MKDFGERLRQIRKQNSLSQKEFAQKINVSDKLISKWENDLSVPNLEYLLKISEVFSVDLDFLIGKNEKNIIKADKTKKKMSYKTKGIIAISILGFLNVAIITMTIILSIFVFVPNTHKQQYIYEIEKGIQNNFSLGYYDYTLTTKTDDKETKQQEKVIYDEYGLSYEKIENSGRKIIIKDDIKYDSLLKARQVYVLDNIHSVYEAFIYFSKDSVNENISTEDISYIRKVNNGFYIEYSQDAILRELDSATQKKIRFIGKIYGYAFFEGEYFKSLDMQVEFKVGDDNLSTKVFTSLEFNLSKPQIEFSQSINEEPWTNLQAISTDEFVLDLAGDKKVQKLDFAQEDYILYNDKAYYFEEYNLIEYDLNLCEKSLSINTEALIGYSYAIVPQLYYVYKDLAVFYHLGDVYVLNITSGEIEFSLLDCYYYSYMGAENQIWLYDSFDCVILDLDTLSTQELEGDFKPLLYTNDWFYYDKTINCVKNLTTNAIYSGKEVAGVTGDIVITFDSTTNLCYLYNGNSVTTYQMTYLNNNPKLIVNGDNYYFINKIMKENINFENYDRLCGSWSASPVIIKDVYNNKLICQFDSYRYSYVDLQNNKYLQPVICEDSFIIHTAEKFDLIITDDAFYKVYDELVADYRIDYVNTNENATWSFDEQNPKSYNYNSVVEISNPTSEHFEFVGWTSSEITTPTKNLSWSGKIGNVKLFANWIEKQYLLEYDFDGGTYGGEIKSYYSFSSLNEEIFITPSREGSNFLGWYSGEQKIDNVADLLKLKDAKLVAKWDYKTYQVSIANFYNVETEWTVMFDVDGNTSQIPAVTVTPTQSFSYPQIPSKERHVFTGWFYDKECSSLFNLTDSIKCNTTLYAGWYKIPNDVSYSDLKIRNLVANLNGSVTYAQNELNLKSRFYFCALEDCSYTYTVRNSDDYATWSFVYDCSKQTQMEYVNGKLQFQKGNIYYIQTYSDYWGGDIQITLSLFGDVPNVSSKAEYSDNPFVTTVAYNSSYTLPTFSNVQHNGYYYYDENRNKVYVTNSNGESLKPYLFENDIILYFDLQS